MVGASEQKDEIAVKAATIPAETVRIAVVPTPGAWMVDASFNDSPLVFQSREAASRAAQKFAQAAAASGRPVELHIHPDDH